MAVVFEKQIAIGTEGGVDVFDANGPTQMVTQIYHRPEFTSDATIAAYDEVISEVREKEIAEEELAPVDVPVRAELVSLMAHILVTVFETEGRRTDERDSIQSQD